jgi:hypothetical protein
VGAAHGRRQSPPRPRSGRRACLCSCIAILVTALLVGCSSTTKPPTKKTTKPPIKKKPAPLIINATNVFDEYKGAKNELLWNLKIENGTFNVAQAGSKAGTTGSGTNVSGEIFDKGKVNCRYKAKHGEAVNTPTNRKLTLNDQVEVDAVDPPGRLLCDKLIYDGIKKFFIATGHVQVLGTLGTKGTLDEVWATPDLTKIASPELFNQP